MKITKHFPWVPLWMVAMLFLSGNPAFGDNPPIQGLAGLEFEGDLAYLAIRVDVPSDKALSGILWYNNDQEVVFPRLLVGTGYPDRPGLVGDALSVGSDLSGESSDWSAAAFDVPVGAVLEGLYVIFEVPNQPYTAPGTGGGAAIGYGHAEGGSLGWVSGDGEEWSRLNPEFGFSILPSYVPFEEGMALKSMGGEVETEPVADAILPLYLTAGPNPFNPRTEIRFGLPAAGPVRIDIFDLRGHLVRHLVDEVMAEGHHRVNWQGENQQGGNAASGLYFLRLMADGQNLTQRLILVR